MKRKTGTERVYEVLLLWAKRHPGKAVLARDLMEFIEGDKDAGELYPHHSITSVSPSLSLLARTGMIDRFTEGRDHFYAPREELPPLAELREAIRREHTKAVLGPHEDVPEMLDLIAAQEQRIIALEQKVEALQLQQQQPPRPELPARVPKLSPLGEMMLRGRLVDGRK